MTTQFIINDKGEKTAAIVPINEYEDLIHQHHLNLELSDDYKQMIDKMIAQEENGQAKFVSAEDIKSRFMSR
ncbi:MAG: hypothetical protein JWR50_1432 [Mucilaginibacter sp.]|nr:hypothetical protein [Mucilaginibacter sp.]